MIMAKYFRIFLIIAIISCNNDREEYAEQVKYKYDYKEDGYVPDERTAVEVAKAVLLPIYGKSILEQQPYKAKINGRYCLGG